MNTPSSRHMARYRAGDGPFLAPGCLHAPTFLRNSPPIIAALSPFLAGASGPVLEIGSGTGQHAAAMALAFPGLRWVASDPDDIHRVSIAAWAEKLRAPGNAPLDLDATMPWHGRDDVAALGPLRAVVSMNVIHIAPVAVLDNILLGASRRLAPGGLVIFYGPFTEAGRHTGAGNAAFDQGLRAENPEWGLRDLDQITQDAGKLGLNRRALLMLPANNRIVVLQKEAT